MSRALFLDRDGIINIDLGYTYRIQDFQFVEGLFPLCKDAQAKGYRLIVVTNQSGIARGLYSERAMTELHDYMQQELEQAGIRLDAIYYCPHHPDFTGKCLCRKPGSLLIEKGISRFTIHPPHSFMIGDSERDILAGKAAGCQTILVGSGQSKADFRVLNLAEITPLLPA